MSSYDSQSLYDFLHNTPEGALRKMLVDNQPMSDVHFNILMKVSKRQNQEVFIQCFENKSFPKVKFSPAESKLKEKFWDDCIQTLSSRGLLQPAIAGKAA